MELHFTENSFQKANEYDQEKPQSYTTDQPTMRKSPRALTITRHKEDSFIFTLYVSSEQIFTSANEGNYNSLQCGYSMYQSENTDQPLSPRERGTRTKAN